LNSLLKRWLGGGQRQQSVSRWRRGVGFLLLILVAGTFIVYHQLTNEERLRVFAERWLENFSGGEADIKQVRFDLFRGLDIVGVKLAIPKSAHFDPHDNSFEARTIFQASTLFFRLDLLSIISGELIVPEVIAIDPDLTLLQRTTDGTGNWEVMFQNRKVGKKASIPSHLPEIRLRNARLRQYHLDERGRSGGPPQTIRVIAHPLATQKDVYEIWLTKIVTSAKSEEIEAEAGRIELDLDTLAVSGNNLPTLSFKELRFSVPPEIRQWMDVLTLGGNIKMDSFSYGPDSINQAELILREATFSIPLDPGEKQLPPTSRYIRFNDVTGTLSFEGLHAWIKLEGRFRNSPLTVRGEMFMAEGRPVSLEGIGFDLDVNVTNLPLPRDSHETSDAEARFVRRWDRLRKFVRDFDGIGPVDISLKLHKSPGTGKGVEFVEGTLVPRAVSARYIKFPYRVHDLTGKVVFRKDRMIELVNLEGVHGQGKVIVNGILGGYRSQFGKLDIVGDNISLDKDLLSCLSDRDQRLCNLFNAQAKMNIHVQLQRKDAPHGTQGNPWKPVIDVMFTDGSVQYDRFPYPLNQLKGKMRIANRDFEIQELNAKRQNAKVRISGYVKQENNKGMVMDLALEGINIPLDEVLADALPDHSSAMYRNFNPSGLCDLKGRLSNDSKSGSINYELLAFLKDAGLSLSYSKGRLEEVNATVQIDRQQIEIQSLHGRFGESYVEMTGRCGTRPDDPNMSLNIKCDRLRLNRDLYKALPETAQKTWDMFNPSGIVKLDLNFNRHTFATQPVGQNEPEIDYKIVLEPIECSATFNEFPLPLDGIQGRMVLQPDGVVLDDVVAHHGEMKLRLKGHVDLLGSEKRVELSIDAHNMQFTEALRQAVPWRIRRMWNNVKPRGQADLFFEKLAFTLSPNREADWNFCGKAKFKGMSFQIGSDLSDVQGNLNLRGKMGSKFACEGDLSLSKIRVDKRLVTKVSAKLSRLEDDPIFRVEDIFGRFYGGTIVGNAEVDYSGKIPAYGISLTACDVSLAEFLNAKRKKDEKPVSLKGMVEGNLSLAGKFNQPRSRRGGGSVLIREAQMFKVPLILAILQVIHFAIDDNNAFHDGTLNFIVDGDELIINEIDLRGKALSMIGAGRVNVPTQGLNVTLLIGSPLRLPRIEVLSELLEGVARELMEVHVEGSLTKPTFRAEIVRSLKKTIQAILDARRIRNRDSSRIKKIINE